MLPFNRSTPGRGGRLPPQERTSIHETDGSAATAKHLTPTACHIGTAGRNVCSAAKTSTEAHRFRSCDASTRRRENQRLHRRFARLFRGSKGEGTSKGWGTHAVVSATHTKSTRRAGVFTWRNMSRSSVCVAHSCLQCNRDHAQRNPWVCGLRVGCRIEGRVFGCSWSPGPPYRWDTYGLH